VGDIPDSDPVEAIDYVGNAEWTIELEQFFSRHQ